MYDRIDCILRLICAKICHEVVREQFGSHPCDRRSVRTRLQSEFPKVDFSMLSEEDDVMWTPARETEEHVDERASKFLDWLQLRPETQIAVVSHDRFLSGVFSQLVRENNLFALSYAGLKFRNCELRRVDF